MSRYTRLTEVGFDGEDSDLFEFGEVGLDFLDKLTEGDAALGHPPEAERGQRPKSIRDHICTVPSTEISSKLQNSIGYRLAEEQQKLQLHQDVENSNPNTCPRDSTTPPADVTICSHSSTATGHLQEQQQTRGGGGRGGDSRSGRWVERNIEERSGRWRTVGCESYHRDNSSRELENVNIISTAPSSRPSFGQSWIPSIQQASYRDRKLAVDHLSQESFSSLAGTRLQHPQPQEKLSCTRHSSGIDTRQCQRFSKELSPRYQFNAPIPGPEKRSLASVTHPRSDASYGGSFTQDKGPIFQRSSSAREAPGLQRSSSASDTPGQRSEMSIENWMDLPASKSAHESDRAKHRVSFSLTENHEVETQKLREKFREPIAPCKKFLQTKHQTSNQHPLRYEQPGFVESEKENIRAGKAYTIYGMKEVKDCPKGSSARHHPKLVRAFSLRENGSNYTKMTRAYSVNAGGRHLMPMECDTCGKGGIGIVFLGPPGDDANFCKSCKSSSGSGWSCGESKPPKKKKSIMDYCRNILRLPQKFR